MNLNWHSAASRLVVLACALVASILGLTACGDDANDTSETQTTVAQTAQASTATAQTQADSTEVTGDAPSASAESSEAETAAEIAAEPVTITVWDFLDQANKNGPSNDTIDQMYMDEHPNVTIDRVAVPREAYFTKLRAAVAAQEGPDVVLMYPGIFAADYAASLRPLDDLMTAEQMEDLQFLNQASTAGTLYAVPWTAYAYVFEINTELFAKAGLDPNAPPTTWDEFLSACDAFNAAGITPMAAGFKDGFEAEWFLFTFGSQLFSSEEIKEQSQGAIPWTDERYHSAFQHLLELKDRKCFAPNADSQLIEDSFNDFYSGKAAMYLSLGSDLKKAESLGIDKITYILPPRLPDSAFPGQMTDSSWNIGWAITDWSEHQEEAWEFISFMLSPTAQDIIFAADPSQLPSTKSSQASPDSPALQKLLEFVKIPENQSIYNGFRNEELVLLERLSPQVFAGRMSIDDMLSQLEAVRNKLGPVEIQ